MKSLVLLTTGVGSAIGGYLPTLWGDSGFSLLSLVFGTFGGLLGLWVGYQIMQYVEG